MLPIFPDQGNLLYAPTLATTPTVGVSIQLGVHGTAVTGQATMSLTDATSLDAISVIALGVGTGVGLNENSEFQAPLTLPASPTAVPASIAWLLGSQTLPVATSATPDSLIEALNALELDVTTSDSEILLKTTPLSIDTLAVTAPDPILDTLLEGQALASVSVSMDSAPDSNIEVSSQATASVSVSTNLDGRSDYQSSIQLNAAIATVIDNQVSTQNAVEVDATPDAAVSESLGAFVSIEASLVTTVAASGNASIKLSHLTVFAGVGFNLDGKSDFQFTIPLEVTVDLASITQAMLSDGTMLDAAPATNQSAMFPAGTGHIAVAMALGLSVEADAILYRNTSGYSLRNLILRTVASNYPPLTVRELVDVLTKKRYLPEYAIRNMVRILLLTGDLKYDWGGTRLVRTPAS